MINHDWEAIHELISLAPIKPPTGLISVFAEKNRLLPIGTPFPGFWSNKRTPYWVEPMDNMGPYSPITHEIIVKPAQDGATAMVENIIGYYIKEAACEILYITGNETMLKKWAYKRLEPMIDSIGARKLFQSKTEKTKGKSSGDMTFLKLFLGGALNMASAQSGGNIRSDSIRVLIRDEISSAPIMLRTGEGDWLAVSEARTIAWGSRSKIIDFSTPGVEGECQITKEYEHGDKRKFIVPCPLCGKRQELRWGNDNTQYGIKPETKAGKLVRAYYLCDFCHDAFFNHHKTEILAKGEWKATAVSDSPTLVSRQISGIYRPVGMKTWTDMYRGFQKALKDPGKMPAWVNLELGKAYRPTGARPDLKTVIELRTGYHSGTVPDGVLWLTAFIDVQRGSNTDKANPPRLEMEICGHGRNFRTWSILYKVFSGEVDDPSAGAWADLDDFNLAGGMMFLRDDGRKFGVELTFIDSGYSAPVVYQFCAMWTNTLPTKGRGYVSRKKNDDPDLDISNPASDYKQWGKSRVGDNMLLYLISTIHYKDLLYMRLKIPRQDTGEQRRGFCEFPFDYPDRYFEMLRSEVKRSDGYHAGGRRNEALDCRVGNMCAGDVWLGVQIGKMGVLRRGEGWTQSQVERIDHQYILDHLEQATAKKIK